MNPGGTMPTPVQGQPPPQGNTQGYYFTLSTPTGPANFWLPAGNVPSDIAEFYFRSDTPGGLSTEPVPPDVVERLRNYVNSGMIVPTDQTAIQFVQSQGGYQPGDITPLGPLIGGEAGGLTPEQWNIVIQQTQQEIDQQEALGRFTDPATGQPISTLDREKIEADIAAQVFQNQTARLLAENTVTQTQAQIRQTDTQLQQAQQQLDDARRAGDLDRQQAASQEIARLQENQRQYNATLQLQQQQLAETQRQYNENLTLQQGQLSGTYNGAPTEAARQFNEQLAQQQREYLAQASADPNRIVESADLARLYGASRGGTAATAPPPGTGAGADSTGVLGMPLAYTAQTAAGMPPGTPGTPGTPGAGAPGQGGIQVALSPENVSYLTGQTIPQFGNPSGVQGQTVDLSQFSGAGSPYSFRQTPAAYNALSPTAKTELGTINQSVTGQRPEDWATDIKKQLPSTTAGLPAAYAF